MIYIHIPFCERKCPYCDFYSVCDKDLMIKYKDALIKKIREFPYNEKADTVYFGGGTPSLFADYIGDVLEEAAKKFSLSSSAEITAEVNPHSAPRETLEKLYSAGVNRLSIGTQSFVDDELKTLCRLHTAKDAENTFYTSREIGFNNISLDLMLGIWGQTEESLSISLNKIKELSPQHVSAYMLILEEGTAFENKVPIDDEIMAKEYCFVCEKLEEMGLLQYEISNFAKPGFQCRHNLKYWRDEEYIGFGPAAHSFYKGERFYYPRDIMAFISGNQPVFDCIGGGKQEKIMLGLRLSEGIDENLIQKDVTDLIKAGLINKKDGRISLTRQGFLLSNAVISKLI